MSEAGGVPEILVVEDDPDYSSFLSEVIRRSGAIPHRARDGLSAVELVKQRRPNLVLLDLGLPKVDGSSLVEVFRYELDTPVVIVSGRDSTKDVVTNLERGADDYLVKPVRSSELIARVRAVLRRTRMERPEPEADEVLDFGELIIDLGAKRVLRRDVSVSLTPREFDLLAYLVRGRGRPHSRREILEAVWDSSPATSAASTVNEHVRRLRQKLELNPSVPRWIVTVTGFGYEFDPGHRDGPAPGGNREPADRTRS